ncbi:hypothetical protein [Embleya hyalina]|uniref:hypothetical protein n=1 Tax=Embleya hyalina TaxID=516124 RepID=UPI000F82AD24|nr:hypothetical protein [Embleya hyalina]
MPAAGFGTSSRDPGPHGQYHDPDFEQALPGALNAVVDTFPAYDPEVIPRGVARGKRIRRVRRIRIGAAACAMAVTVVGVGVVLDRAMETDASAASRRTLPDGEGPSAWPVTGNQMIAALESLLPAKGKVSEVSGGGSQLTPQDPPLIGRNPFAQLVYTDSGGSSGIRVMLARPAPDSPESRIADCGAVDERRPYDECTTHRQPDGSKLSVAKTVKGMSGAPGQRHWRVILDRPDGGRVSVDAFSGGARDQWTGDNPNGVGVGLDPRLTVDQLTRIATDARWIRGIDALPTPDRRVLGVLQSVLPAGTDITAKGESAHGATVVLRDGKGLTNLSASVRMTAGPLESCAGIADCRTRTLPDGSTTFAARQPVGNAAPEFVQWRVAIRHPDGRTVLLNAGNNARPESVVINHDDYPGIVMEANLRQPKTSRTEPGLTLDQLEAIAADPRWTR